MENPFKQQAEYHRLEAIKWNKAKTFTGIVFVIVVILSFLF